MKDAVFYERTKPVGKVRPLSSVLKTLGLIEIIAKQGKPTRLADIARAAGMGRGAAHQKLVTLAQAGWIEHADNGYRLSLHAARIGSSALEQASLGERVVPFLEDLVSQSQETASLAVITGDAACIVQRVESVGVLRAELRIGAMLDLPNSASGRVLVAFAKDHQLEEWRKREIALPDEKIVAQVKREKFADSSGLSYEGVRAIAAPVFDEHRQCVAALSLVGPLPRFNGAKLRPHLERAAARITAHIGGR
ncbi:MAG: IclR family transcriptional regulator [Pseudolabrys sp.]